MANNTGLTREELTFWLKHTADSLAGKEVEYTDDQKKQLEHLSHRKPNMNDVTSTAHLVADALRQDTQKDIEMLQSTVGLLMNIIQGELDLTDDKFTEYAKEYQEQIKEAEKELRKQKEKDMNDSYKQAKESHKESSEKVVQINKDDK